MKSSMNKPAAEPGPRGVPCGTVATGQRWKSECGPRSFPARWWAGGGPPGDAVLGEARRAEGCDHCQPAGEHAPCCERAPPPNGGVVVRLRAPAPLARELVGVASPFGGEVAAAPARRHA